jgi:hypothetical protein
MCTFTRAYQKSAIPSSFARRNWQELSLEKADHKSTDDDATACFFNDNLLDTRVAADE